jgi:uncharacterized membrane protein
MSRRMKSLYPSSALSVAVALCIAVAAAAAFAHEGHSHTDAVKPTPEERAAFEAAKPAFERSCFRCHTAAGKKSKRKAIQHLAMDAYPFGGHHAHEVGKVVRRALGVGGDGKATMPSDEPGTVTGEDLRLILAWADAFDRAHPTPAKLDAPPPVQQGVRR